MDALCSNTRRACILAGLVRISISSRGCTASKMSNEKSFHMTPEEFRRHGHAVVDWIADYQSRIESFPVLSQVKPG